MVKIKQKTNRVQGLYKNFYLKYGRPEGQWKLWCKRPKTILEKEEVIIGAILTQRANWKNVDLAIERLKNAGVCSFRAIYNLGRKNQKSLAELIKPSGFYKQKAEYLFGISKFFIQDCKVRDCFAPLCSARNDNNAMAIDEMRNKLLKQKGIGPETADSILLYALEEPVFVIDEYTKRLVKKHQLSKNLSYSALQELFENNLKRDYLFYQDFHALIVIDGKNKTLL